MPSRIVRAKRVMLFLHCYLQGDLSYLGACYLWDKVWYDNPNFGYLAIIPVPPDAEGHGMGPSALRV